MARITQSVQQLTTIWTVQSSNPGKGEIFCTHAGAHQTTSTMDTKSLSQ